MGRVEIDISKGLWTQTTPPPPGYLQTADGWLNTEAGNMPLYGMDAVTATPSVSISSLGMYGCFGFDGNYYMFVASSNGHIYRTTDLLSFTDVTKISATYATTATWSFASYGNWLIATNGVDAPQVLKNIDNSASASYAFTDLGGTPPKAKYVMSHSQSGQVIFGNVTVNPGDGLAYPKRIYFSALQTAEDYTTTLNGAGYQDFADVIGNCSGIIQQGGSGIVVGFDKSIVYGQWTGVNGLWWSFNPPITGRGTMPYSIVSADGSVYAVDSYGALSFDGQKTRNIDIPVRFDIIGYPFSIGGVAKDPVNSIVYWSIVQTVALAPTRQATSLWAYNYLTSEFTHLITTFTTLSTNVAGYGLILVYKSPYSGRALGAINIPFPAYFRNTGLAYLMSSSSTIDNSLISGFVGDPDETMTVDNVLIPGYVNNTWGAGFSATLTAYDSSFTAISGATKTLNSSNFNARTGLFDVGGLTGNFFTITLTNVTPNVNKLLFTKVVLFTDGAGKNT